MNRTASPAAQRPAVTRSARRPLSRRLQLLVASALFIAFDAFVLEPRLLLWRDDVVTPLVAAPLRIVHLSDLHVARETALYRRLLRSVAAESPDLVVISGDFVDDTKDLETTLEATAAAAHFLGELRRIAPIVGVQGHSEYVGPVVVRLADAGVEFLSNEGRRVGPGGTGTDAGVGGVLLLGLNQQVGDDRLVRPRGGRFRVHVDEEPPGYALTIRGTRRNVYASFDPAPDGDGDASGPHAWSGYEAYVEAWVETPLTGAGLCLHCRHVLGEDRHIRFGRGPTERDPEGTVGISLNGTERTSGAPETPFDPPPRTWFALRARTVVDADAVRIEGRAWRLGEPEPEAWQAWAEDRSRHRVAAGTIGLWGWGRGTVVYRNLRVTAASGELLLERTLIGRSGVAGFRSGARASRLELALARSPEVPPGTPRIVLSHVPEPVLEAAELGLDLVLAGHTHGGQVRLPFLGALTTRNELGPHYDRGRFELAGTSPRGFTTLYVNAGIGTSFVPVRFWDPPTYAVVELGPQ